MVEKFAIELMDVVKRFGDITAVNHVSLQIRDGEFFSLLGPSGCGKTTTLRLIAGFEMPTTGEIYISGELQGYLPAFKRPVNTVFQHYALFPHMTVQQNVAFGLEMQRIPAPEVRRRVGEALDLVRLPHMHQRRPEQLSGGQQQRVALARALVNHPKVLLLDEPLGALDLKLRKAMQVELKALQNQVGITFMYVTHDQEEALTMSDRIAVMNKGSVLQIGSPEDIYENPANRFVADFIGETNFIPGAVKRTSPTPALELAQGISARAGWIEVGLDIGEPALLSIRPEKIRLSPPGASSEISTAENLVVIPGKIVEMMYLGTDTRYVIHLAGKAEVLVRSQNFELGGMRFQIGEPVDLCWDPTHARILKE